MKNVLSIKYSKIIILLIALNTCYLIHNTKASASTLSLGVYPPVIKIDVLPPASLTTTVTIKNYNDEPVNLKILFKPFKASAYENGTLVYYRSFEEANLADPLLFQKIQVYEGDRRIEEVKLAPMQEKNLDLHLGFLKDDPLSDYYFSVVFISQNSFNENLKTNLSQISGGLAVPVLLSVGPKEKTQGLIEEFSAPLFLEKGPVPFTVRVKNSGRRVINPQGAILIKNMFNQTIGRVELLPVNILAGSIRALPDSHQSSASTPSSIVNNEFLINKTAAFWPENFLLGFYTADLAVALSDEGPVFRKQIHFFAMPIQIVVGTFVSILILSIIGARIRYKLKSKRI